ncbi:Box C/D snoRNA accumulation [Malassezia caprae]|uniref:Box C/D snoRNA accumulation n=1 Tax=Malassezia caprae TaxID=1381934 RepID=A0AAF0IU91_9BASI|nr:Box C/D snoRNA accumulation [Malassezia caprae]
MKDYDYNQMLDDYQFLNKVGRVVSSTGRSLSEAHMLPPDHAPGPGVRRGPASQQRRDALAKQLGFHKLPIMLLPDGMSRRKMNHLTRFSQGLLVHGLTASTMLSTWLLGELQRQCARQHQVPLSQWHLGTDTSEPKPKRLKEDQNSSFWRMDHAILTSLGLTCSDDTWSAWPSSVRPLLHVYELRLRNETTSKYLDWWVRKGAALEKPQSLVRGPPSMPALVPQHVLDHVSQLRPDTQPMESAVDLSNTVQHFVEVPMSMSLDTLLRSLPAGFGIVEFLEVALWPAQALVVAQRRGQIQLHPLQEPAPSVQQNAMQDQQLPPAVSKPAPQPVTASVAASTEPLPTPAVIPTPTLVAYADSDSDDEA